MTGRLSSIRGASEVSERQSKFRTTPLSFLPKEFRVPRRSGGRLFRLLTAAALTVTASVTASAQSTATAAPGSPALTPPLGWNSWNSFGCGITEAQVRQAADAMVSSGMRDAGYRYVVVDDCWFDPQRDAQGNLRANPTKFPSGMKALGDYIHSKGLKFGIYQVPGERTCAQTVGTYPGSTGSRGHEVQDARTFASWGVDYLKYDWCSSSGTRDEQVARFTLMRDALRATGRPIVYSINPNSFHAITGSTYNWGEVADLWRTTEDLLDIWQNGNTNSYPMGVGNVLDVNAPLAAQSGPGHWNDPDMLVVGRPGLSLTESRSHFALWALMSAPLTTFDLDRHVLDALRAGAVGFLLKDGPAQSLVEAVRMVAAGDAVLSPRVTRRLLDRFARLPQPAVGAASRRLEHLTAREVDVLRALSRGLSNEEIAQELDVSKNTVRTHIAHILEKYHLRDRVQAVILAYDAGLVTPVGHASTVR